MSEPIGRRKPRARLRDEDPDAEHKPNTPVVVVLYRSVYGAPPPRRIRLAGAPPRPRDGATAQPWHCQPFVAGATYGLEQKRKLQ